MKILKSTLSVILSLVLVFCAVISVSAWGISNDYDESATKNVILLIGDGMGENHLMLAKQELGIELTMDTLPIKGQSMTRSFSSSVTDSAAGATALSCGVRTINGCVGVFPFDPCGAFVTPVSITEAALRNGLKAGVVTSDSTAGATPAGFSAHTMSRSNSDDISKQQTTSDIDLIWGAACSDVDTAIAEANGFDCIDTKSEMNALAVGSKSFGQFASDTWKSVPENAETPSLSEMSKKAIEILDNEEGFFLMIEGAHIDKHSHNKDAAKAVIALQEFDNAVKVALDFAKADGNTLVVVTADHETGGIKLIDGKYKYTQGSHSGANVPLRMYGPDCFIKDGEIILNKQIPEFISINLGVNDSFSGYNMGKLLKLFK